MLPQKGVLVPAAVSAVSAAAYLPLLALAVVAAAVGPLHDARRPRPTATLAVADYYQCYMITMGRSIVASWLLVATHRQCNPLILC